MASLDVSTAAGVATLTLSRGKVNALNPELVESLRVSPESLERDPSVSVVAGLKRLLRGPARRADGGSAAAFDRRVRAAVVFRGDLGPAAGHRHPLMDRSLAGLGCVALFLLPFAAAGVFAA